MEYVEPYLTSLMNESPDRTLKEIEMALRIPWCIWNAIVHQKRKNEGIDYMRSIELLTKNMPIQAKQMIESLKTRKIKYFSEYNYIIGEYSLYIDEQSQKIRLRVEARGA